MFLTTLHRSRLARCAPLALLVTFTATSSHAANWTRFRGENGSGVSPDAASIPHEWSETKNLKWSVDLPGAGKSSPIVVGDRVILTAWTGTGPDDLVRHVLCFNRNTGEQLWAKEVPPAVPDEPFRQMFTENGYASHTPATDGERIYCFFGVTGVVAYDMDGNQVWQKSVGTEFNRRDWGSASSPILYKDWVIVTAGAESASMVALRKEDGEEVWRQPADALGEVWGTPVLLDGADGQQDIVVAVGGELWGVNPENGKLRWHAVAGRGEGMRISAIVDGGLAFMLGERGSGAIAVRGGGEDDVTDTHVAWRENYSGNIGTPVAHDDLIYWASQQQLTCVDAKTGEEVYRERFQAPPGSTSAPGGPEGGPGGQGGPGGPPPGRPDEGAPGAGPGPDSPGPGGPGPGGPGGFGGGRRGGRGGRGGGMRSQDYASPIIADGKLFFPRRNGEVYVFATGREFKQLAVNKFESDDGDFSSSPAASDGQLFIRSSKKLYCVAAP